MTQPTYKHDFEIGDAVLVKMGTARVPGVISDRAGDGRLTVQLAEPWTDETGRSTDTTTVTPNDLEVYINEETGGRQALPG